MTLRQAGTPGDPFHCHTLRLTSLLREGTALGGSSSRRGGRCTLEVFKGSEGG